VPLGCPASEQAGCEGTLLLETVVQVRASAVVARRTVRRKRTVKLGKSSFRVAGGRSAAVKVRLSKKSQQLVRRLEKLRVLATVNARDQAGNAQTTKKPLVLKAARARGARR
jgi:hypothetical protein